LKETRERANLLADGIMGSVYLKMFGDPVENPMGWPTMEVQEISREMQPGFAFGKFNLMQGIPHLRPFNISRLGRLRMDEVKFVPEESLPPNSLLALGDLIFNNTNSEELLGKSALFTLPITATLSNHMTRIRLNEKLALPEYVWLSFNRLFQRGFFARMSKRWVNQAAVDTNQLSVVRIPIPPLENQRRIALAVQKFEGLSKKQSQSTQEIDGLFHSLMHKAFRAELGSQELPDPQQTLFSTGTETTE
jgi:type I restriction enzyme S subunit